MNYSFDQFVRAELAKRLHQQSVDAVQARGSRALEERRNRFGDQLGAPFRPTTRKLSGADRRLFNRLRGADGPGKVGDFRKGSPRRGIQVLSKKLRQSIGGPPGNNPYEHASSLRRLARTNRTKVAELQDVQH